MQPYCIALWYDACVITHSDSQYTNYQLRMERLVVSAQLVRSKDLNVYIAHLFLNFFMVPVTKMDKFKSV